MASPISTVPEELLERILSFALAPPRSFPSSPSAPSFPPLSQRLSAGPLSSLLVCKLWLRIATPLYYQSVTLSSQLQTNRFASLLEAQPDLAACIKEVRVEGLFPGLVEVFKHLGSARVSRQDALATAHPNLGDNEGKSAACKAVELHTLDIRMDGLNSLEDVSTFCDALRNLTDIRHLVVRKAMLVYLTLPAVLLVMMRLADGIKRWKSLESVELAFRFTPISSMPPVVSDLAQHQQYSLADLRDTKEHPSVMLVSALSQAPNLKVVKTELPAVWNEALLEVSKNPSLREIQFTDTISPPSPPPLILPPRAPHPPSHQSHQSHYSPSPSPSRGRPPNLNIIHSIPSLSSLYMRTAKKYPRLLELIRAGTDTISDGIENGCVYGARHRAWTLDSPPSSPPAVIPLSAPANIPISDSSPSSSSDPSTSVESCVAVPKSKKGVAWPAHKRGHEEVESCGDERRGSPSTGVHLEVGRETRKGKGKERRLSAV